MSLKFVGLHAHSAASIGDAIGLPKEHFDFVIKNSGEDSMSLAISDHGNANSFGYILQAANDFKKKGINFKPIFGQELYLIPDLDEWARLKQQKAEEKEETEEAVVENEAESKGKWFDPIKRRHHLVILAKNDVGLKNLFKLTTRSYRKGFYRFPRVDFKELDACKEGLIISTACLAGLGSWLILREEKNGEQAIQNALDAELKPMLDIFGKENANVEIQFNRLKEQMIVNDQLIKFAKRNDYPVIACADSHYSKPADWKDRELYRLLARQSRGYEFNKDDLPKTIEELHCELYPKSGDQMFDAYLDMMKENQNGRYDDVARAAIERTYQIAHDQIEFIQPNGSMKLPRTVVPADITPFNELKRLCIEGLKAKNFDKNKIYIDRLVVELGVIKQKDFALYFLTLKKAIDELRGQMLCGFGRGSGAGSLVCYVLNITQVDPIKNGLLFERFLSVSRNEAPDIDNDVEDKELCLDVLQKTFGKDNVVPVSNFNTLQLKSLVKDISKFFDIPYQEVNEVTSKMETEARPHILEEIGGDQKLYVFDLEGAKKYSPSFQEFLRKYPHVADHIEVLFKQNKSVGRHAGGIIITENTEEVMPVIRVRGTDQTPWTEGMAARHLEQFGLIKYDFLGLATLRVIRKCVELIIGSSDIVKVNEFFGENLAPDVIKPDDIKVFQKTYWEGKFPGIFQFTEIGVQTFAKSAHPQSVFDIAVLTSIFRPGPLKGRANEKYLDNDAGINHPIVHEVLGQSRNILVFQEQFMLLANKLAGFSLTEADELRKLLMKPITSMAEEMKKKRIEVGEKFIQGCVVNGLSQKDAEHLWEKDILGFISYGFNKSHAICYAYISYICAHLFTYFEREWICAYLQEDADPENALREVKNLGYEIAKPDINFSGKEWTLSGKTLTPPFQSIKSIGEAGIEEIMSLRPFMNLDEMFYTTEIKTFKKKAPEQRKVFRLSKFNKRMLEAMICSEGFESLDCVGAGKTFETYRHMHDVLIESWDVLKKGKQSIEDMAASTEASRRKDWTPKEKIDLQTELFGSFDKTLLLGEDVFKFFREHDILDLTALVEYPQNIWFNIENCTVKTTKTGKKYFSLEINDLGDKKFRLNYWDPEIPGGFERNRIYVAQLYMKEGWINKQKWTEMIKL